MVAKTGARTVIADRYQLRERTAADTSGETWAAADLTLGRPVRLRLLRHARTQDITRFLATAQRAASVSHPGVVRVYDYGQAGVERTPFLVTEPAGYTSLATLLSARPLEPAWVLDLLAQTASALSAAHSAGLVHDHITPGSLLLGPGGAVKLSDFSFPRDTRPAPAVDPVYLAPERTRGDLATPASDLYALGVVAWECLAGKSARNRPLPKLPAMVGPGVAALVADLTATDPSDRTASAARAADRASGLLALPLRPADASISLTVGQPGQSRPERRPKDLSDAGPGITTLMAPPGAVGTISLSQFGRLQG